MIKLYKLLQKHKDIFAKNKQKLNDPPIPDYQFNGNLLKENAPFNQTVFLNKNKMPKTNRVIFSKQYDIRDISYPDLEDSYTNFITDIGATESLDAKKHLEIRMHLQINGEVL